MAFLGFLMMFSYTVLVRLEENPNIQECLVISYILTMAAEKAREVKDMYSMTSSMSPFVCEWLAQCPLQLFMAIIE